VIVVRKILTSNVRLVGFDVDGVFTDGRFYLSDDGVESKTFSTQDGFGIRQLLDSAIDVVIISGRKSVAVERRMAELGIKYVIQGCKDKVAALDSVISDLEINLADTIYVGDDIPDLELLRHVGFSIAVGNAVDAVKEECDAITHAKGGYGAVREVCEFVVGAMSD
tara:strand:- start:1218 stop:1715 length:498 start_codon:yes stop_codon:yes gene_type:complete